MKIGACVACAAAALLAQQPSNPQRFRATANLVDVDVVVTDRSGTPVRGLTKDDFEVLEDGKNVQVAEFTAIDLPEPPSDTAIPSADRSGAATVTNDYPVDGRVFLLVLDDFHIRFDAYRLVKTKRIARRFVERLGPADLAAMVSTSSRSDLSVEFTSDKARLLAALDRFLPSGEGSAMGVAESGTQARNSGDGFVATLKARFSMSRLSGTAKALAEVHHRRKAVVLISEGLPFGLDQTMGSSGADDVLRELREFIQTAQRANVAVYSFDPGSFEGLMSDRKNNLRSIAEGTGGFATVDTDNIEPAVDRMVTENGTYYLLGYYSPAKPYDGKLHRITVHSSRPGVEVRARQGYVSPRSAPKAATAANGVDELIAAPLQTRGLPLRVEAVPALSATGPALALTIDVPAPLMTGQGLQLVASAVSLDDWKVKATDRAELKILDASPSSGWIRIASKLDVTPGRYQVRVAARRVAGPEQGSAFVEIVVPKFDGDIALGGLFLGTSGLKGVIHAEKLAPLLPAIPIATRDLPAGLALVAAVPIKVARKHAGAQVTLAAVLTRPDGSTADLERTTRPASSFAREGGDVYAVALPTLAGPGRYRLSVDASLGDRKAISRELSFVR